jgi:hypothetical protein
MVNTPFRSAMMAKSSPEKEFHHTHEDVTGDWSAE